MNIKNEEPGYALRESDLWLLYKNLPLGLLAVLANAVVVAVIFLDEVSQNRVEAWLLAMLTVLALRYVVYVNFRRQIKNDTQYKKWEILFVIGLVANALVWVASVILFYKDSTLSDHFFLLFVLGGMVAGAIYLATYKFYMYAIYNIPILTVLMFYVSMEGSYYLSGMIALFMMVTLANAKAMADNTVKVNELQRNNENLIEQLLKEQNSVKMALEKVTKANNMKDLFIGNISHEFRTPLNAIQGFTQILQQRPDTPKSMMLMFKKIHASGNQLLVLLDVLMQYSKYKSGTMEYVPTKGSVFEIISALTSEERVRILEKNLTFDVNIPATFIFKADFIMLKFVFNILIEAAIENASNESVVKISALENEEKEQYEVRICNVCPPMTDGEIETMFNPFAQMEVSHESRNLAEGLGLYVAKAMVEDFHQGSLLLEPNASEGYCFVMNILKSRD